MRTAVVCLLACAVLPSVLAADEEPAAAPRPSQARIDGWDLQFLPARPESDDAKLAPVPDPAGTLEPVPRLPHLKAPVCLETFIYRLKYAAAAEAAAALDGRLRDAHALALSSRGLVVESKVVIVPDAAGNSLVVVTTPERSAEIQQLLKKIDAPPKPLTIKARVTQIGPDGQRQTVWNPTVQTLEGRPVAIISKGRDGQQFELELVIEQAEETGRPPIKNVSGTEETTPADPPEWIELTIPPRKGDSTAASGSPDSNGR